MAKFRIDKAYFDRVKQQQEQLQNEVEGLEKKVELCPYCGHKSIVVYKGTKGNVVTKCTKCGNTVIMPVSFRISFRLAFS
jgi:transcription elongation factor Elf1